jgi:hypothetical protein
MTMSNDWRNLLKSEKAVKLIAEQPHILGHIIGKTKLLDVHSEWIRYIWDTNEKRALQAFRGGYKTTSICTVGIIRWLFFHPDDRVAIIRKHVGHAADVVNTVAQAMEYPEIKELFKYRFGEYPRAKIMRNGALQYTFKKTNTPEPSVLALGLDGDITGKHFDKIIIDDFVTMRDRISRAERRNTRMALMEIQANIIDPGKGIGYIGTPWHREDAWKYVNSLCPIAKYPIGDYNFIGEKEVEKKRKMTTPSLFSANYELILKNDEASLFSDPVFLLRWDFSARGAMAQLDAAYDGDHYCALTIAAPIRKEGDNQFYQSIGFTYPGNVKDWIDEIVRLCRKYRAGAIYTETNPDKGYTADKLRGRGLRVKDYTERMNKHLKISTHLYNVWPYLEWAPETDEEYLSQVTDYREGAAPDDAPDSAASLFREAFSKDGANIRKMYEW